MMLRCDWFYVQYILLKNWDIKEGITSKVNDGWLK